jgi:hypothetical protein
MTVDVDERGLARFLPDDVGVPDLVEKRQRHGSSPRLVVYENNYARRPYIRKVE